ncbi:hypothetical protein RB653_000694 [Dictyostelium firmibasis]|uniref:Pre-mRNA-splicing factor ISY1 n=1 Tax=Dictyostelium firmibasis TaxID=79012 RepID=A0AAN7YW50_9MYCE
MARNEEKAKSMLNRYLQLKGNESRQEERRPYLSNECDSLFDAEKWRRQILKEITRGISEIQNSALDEYKIRDLNDHINKLVREKGHWERRILQLGGPNHRALAPKVFDADGKEPLGAGTYRYYGEAKNLPGVAELFEKPEQTLYGTEKKTRQDLYKYVDSDYYGYRDDEDGKLEDIEKEYEKYAIQQNVENWKKQQREKFQINGNRFSGVNKNIENQNNTNKDEINIDDNDDDDNENKNNNNNNNNNTEEQEDVKFKSYVSLPSTSQIESILLEKRKEELRKRYAQN